MSSRKTGPISSSSKAGRTGAALITQVAKFRLTDEVILAQVDDNSQPIMTLDELQKFKQTGLVTYDDPVEVYELLGLVQQLGSEKVLQFLMSRKMTMKEAILGSKLMDAPRAKEERDINIMMEEDKVYVQTSPCPDCGNKNISHYRLQTRGADEGMTTFLTCLNCGRKWRD